MRASECAIVYLSQVRHSSYGRDSLSLLQESLSLLFTNCEGRRALSTQ